MRYWIHRYRWLMSTLLLLVALLAVVKATAAQPPVPHGVIEGDDCLSCHEAGVADALRLARDHAGRLNEDCGFCHEHSGTLADDIPHPVDGREDCLSCHSTGIGTILARSHLDRTNDQCRLCHLLSPAAAEPSPTLSTEPSSNPGVSSAPTGAEIPHTTVGREDCLLCHGQELTGSHVNYTNDQCGLCHSLSTAVAEPSPTPTEPPPTSEVSPALTGEDTCAACHQLIITDDKHAIFTSQPGGGALASGATLFTENCAICHGEDGTTPVGDEGIVINAEAYWSTHDNAAILQTIAAEHPGPPVSGFAQTSGGSLSWEEILNLVAFVRSWGPVGPLLEKPTVEGPNYADTIGPLLTEGCGSCHGAAAGLDVMDYDALMAGSSAGSVVVPGDPDGSLIVEVLQGEHYAQLSEAELNLLIEWIANGAPESTGVEEAALPSEPHPVPLIGAHQDATCEACHVKGEQAPEYVCTNCHQPPENHLEEACDTCHTPKGWVESAASVAAQAPQISHTLDGRDDCLLCHDPTGKIKPAPADHENFDEQCNLCHKLAP